ncbi:hypothetical protein N7466_007422 [Penicillium verhagenii]|uniref:uncharacterized protein n=1 Tax=Penicillium verhagenii TaxID=1562060 RepID=UPI0025458D4F|nr:uncharacterized protein N7466_007422 [Penicillium verhagenii]KAJ5928466.1 hypothetical protein N7466_007422 [Penicillium verhagenii]
MPVLFFSSLMSARRENGPGIRNDHDGYGMNSRSKSDSFGRGRRGVMSGKLQLKGWARGTAGVNRGDEFGLWRSNTQV